MNYYYSADETEVFGPLSREELLAGYHPGSAVRICGIGTLTGAARPFRTIRGELNQAPIRDWM